MQNLFYDSEFTGLTQNSTLISLAFIDENDRSFYAEFTDYDANQVDAWIQRNVIAHCRWLGKEPLPEAFTQQDGAQTWCLGDRNQIQTALKQWLSGYKQVEVWADCLAYDWVLFCELFGGSLHLPAPLSYMPLDLVTLFHLKGYAKDKPRLPFCDMENVTQHNALDDAKIARACYRKLVGET